MKTIQIEIPDGKKVEWVDGVLTLVDEQPQIEFKFKVGDKVRLKTAKGISHIITDRCICYDNTPKYELDVFLNIPESELEPYTETKDITERIQTVEDAYEWCKENNRHDLIEQYQDALNVGLQRAKDILAYLKLRIITCALNEGWEPTFEEDERRYIPEYHLKQNKIDTACLYTQVYWGPMAKSLYLKSYKLAEYAAKKFKDIYMDFCHKGKE